VLCRIGQARCSYLTSCFWLVTWRWVCCRVLFRKQST